MIYNTNSNQGFAYESRVHKHKGHFTLRPLVKKAKDSRNLISGQQKFIHWAFTLKANGLQNAYIASLFVSFGAKNLSDGGQFVLDINGNPNCP